MNQIYTRPLISPLRSTSSYDEKLRIDNPYTTKDHTTSTFKPENPSHEKSDKDTLPPRSLFLPQSKDTELRQSKVGDMYQSISNAPREQLPSLSSLFGTGPPPPTRPVQSPYSDRQSPIFSSTSPQDGRQPATPVHPDPLDSSYFSRSHTSRHYSHNSRPENQERLGYPAHPRPGPRPESPRFAARFNLVDPRQGQAHTSTNWSPRSENSRQDPFQALRAHPDSLRQQPPAPRSEHEARSLYRDHPPVATSYPPTPASTVVGEPLTVKDGLGPKIWTGTQFLPRFVKQADVPGEGLCYFYDDGTHCKTVIDGEIVNAHWGVTKAGKPRKRLAIACITCREKKIKCDPDYPRCVQCEKFGRVCKFKNAPRGGQGSPGTPPADPEDILPRPGSARTDGESFKVEEREASNSVSPRQTLRRASPDSELNHSKRQRNGYNDFTPVASEASPRLSSHDTTSPSTAWLEPPITRSIDHTLLRDWQLDPFITKNALSTELLTVFFKYVPETAYSIFPEKAFTIWARSTREKSLDDLMLIYAILALGAVFSPKPEHKALGAQYAAIARYACDNRRFSIQLVQSRLILALYYFAINNPNDSWDFCGAAMRAASGLKLNVEIENSDDVYLQTYPFGLNVHGYAECRRRTFWSCYIMDRFNGFCSGHLSIIHPEDVFLRLPCDKSSFEEQYEVQNPFFEALTPPIHNELRTIGSMAHLINISTIWGDVMSSIYRSSQRPQPSTSTKFTDFYQSTTSRLLNWRNSLPHCYAFSAENLAKEADRGRSGIYTTMHTVYHTTAMKLNRYVQHSRLNPSQLTHHISVAEQHAKSLLDIMDILSARRASNAMNSSTSAKFSSPFVGYAIISAIDILSAKTNPALIPGLLKSFCGAQSVLAEIALYWQSARTQQATISQRVRDLTEIVIAKEKATGNEYKLLAEIAREDGEGNFKLRESLERTFSRDNDCIYA